MSGEVTQDQELRNHPIGVFDSGVGGLSVLRAIRDRLPHEGLLYCADSAYIPYGDRTTAEIRDRSFAVAASLLRLGAKALVVACNTATAAAIHELRAAYPHLPIIGMEPGLKPALDHSRSRKVGILATAGTLRSDKFRQLLERYGAGAEVVLQPCPGLVEQVESGALEHGETEVLLRRYLDPLLTAGVDVLVLGCTHYSFLLPIIRRLTGDGITVVDTGPAVARQVERQLSHHGLQAGADRVGGSRFYTTGDPALLQPLFTRLWGGSLALESLPVTIIPVAETP